MNILITTGIYPPDVGGPARFVPLIADKLSIKNNVNVLTLSENLDSSEKVNVSNRGFYNDGEDPP